jgi:Bifunctional DNA primase/polymerase, N-terminal
MTTTDLLAAALDLAARGWAVFPCRWRGENAKAPLTNNGQHDASRDPDQIRVWWTRWPQAQIGAVVPESLLVIDVDPRNGGSLAALESLTGPLPETWSGRNDGGHHRFYRRPGGPLTSTRLPKGIDLKVNGYTILPPSIHPATGKPYRWEEHEAADVPNGVLHLLHPKPAPTAGGETYAPTPGALAGLLRTVAEAGEGNRNKALYWAARRVVEEGYPAAALQALGVAARHAGLTDREILRTLTSAQGVRA